MRSFLCQEWLPFIGISLLCVIPLFSCLACYLCRLAQVRNDISFVSSFCTLAAFSFYCILLTIIVMDVRVGIVERREQQSSEIRSRPATNGSTTTATTTPTRSRALLLSWDIFFQGRWPFRTSQPQLQQHVQLPVSQPLRLAIVVYQGPHKDSTDERFGNPSENNKGRNSSREVGEKEGENQTNFTQTTYEDGFETTLKDGCSEQSADQDENCRLQYCPICLSALEPGERVCYGQVCKHVFHATCLHQWTDQTLQQHKASCPYCRQSLISVLDANHHNHSDVHRTASSPTTAR